MKKYLHFGADGECLLFGSDDFDYIINFAGRGYKHLARSNRWFEGETNKEIAEKAAIEVLNRMCVDSNPYCYKNITSNYYEERLVSLRKKKEEPEALNSYASYIISNTPLYTPIIKKIVANDKTTIVMWNNGTKTIVRPSANDNYDLEAAVCAAIAKKIYGTNSAFKRMIKEKVVVQENKKKENKKKEKKDE